MLRLRSALVLAFAFGACRALPSAMPLADTGVARVFDEGALGRNRGPLSERKGGVAVSDDESSFDADETIQVVASVPDAGDAGAVEAGALSSDAGNVGGRWAGEYFGSDRHVMRTSYHATFVMGFLCAAMLRAQPVPPRAPEPCTGATAAVGRITRMLDSAGSAPRWLDAIDQVGPVRQAALAPLLLTAALRRAAASCDIARRRECLSRGLEHGLAAGPAFGQGLRLLERAMRLPGGGAPASSPSAIAA